MSLLISNLTLSFLFIIRELEFSHEEQIKDTEISESAVLISSESKFYPNYGTKLPIHANFCNECRLNFDN